MEKEKKKSHEELMAKRKKFVKYREGTDMYSIGITRCQQIAKDAGAIYKVGGLCLVNTEILDMYLERFRVTGDSEITEGGM